MSYRTEEAITMLQDLCNRRACVGDSLSFHTENPIDPATPLHRRLTIVGWGSTPESITYNVHNWDRITGEFYIVRDPSNPTTCHAVQAHTGLYTEHPSITAADIDEIIACLQGGDDDDYDY